jgi:Arc-like DNA binding domain
MTRDIAPFGLRIPAELKERIEKAAAKNLRSLNSEMVVRLEDSLDADDKKLSEYSIGELIQELIRRREPGLLTIQFESQAEK